MANDETKELLVDMANMLMKSQAFIDSETIRNEMVYLAALGFQTATDRSKPHGKR